MSQRVISGVSLAGMLVVALSLQSCGGGGGGTAFNLPAAAPTPPTVPTATFSVMTKNDAGVVVEAPEVKDDPAVYAVEQSSVMEASVITMDIAATASAPAITFADVNADIDDTDASTPEIDAHLVIDGVGGYLEDGAPNNAKIRLRGSSTRLADQKSYRVKLNSTAQSKYWRGETTLQLNKHPYDLSRVRNKLAFDLFRDIPHVASLRTQFIHMTVTNKDALGVQYASADFGLFTHVEKMGKEYLVNRSLPTDGNVYKAEDFAFTAGGVSARATLASAMDANGKVTDKAKFETVLSLEADNGNHLPLIAMIDDVNNEAIPFDTTFDKYFDKANYLTWLATNFLMGNRDTLNQNFGLYQPKLGTKFYFVPWDYDAAFGFEDQPNEAIVPRYAEWHKTMANWWQVPLHRRFLQDPKHLAELQLAVDQIYNAYLTSAKIKSKVDQYKLLVGPFVLGVPDSANLPTLSASVIPLADQWSDEAERLAVAVKTNHDQFLNGLQAPMPFWQDANLVSNQLELTWDAAVDLQGQTVTYTVELATSPDFVSGSLVSTPVLTANASLLLPKPPDAIYYMRVTARDSAGNTQSAFDRLDIGNNRYFGVSAYRIVTVSGVSTLTDYFGF